MKLTALVSHPIQYQTPLFKKMAEQKNIDFFVYFCWNFGVKEQFNKEFNRKIKWDIPLLDGYRYKFFKNISFKPGNSLFQQINPGVVFDLIHNRPDLLFVHGWNSLTNLMAIITSFLFGIPVGLHGDNSFASEHSKSKTKRFFKKIILGILFKIPRFFFYMGEEDRKFYEFYGAAPQKLIWMPYATDNNWFIERSKILDKKKLKQEIGIDGEIVILFSGKLVERKRAIDLVLAYEEAKKSAKNLALVIVGDGSLKGSLVHYVEEKKITGVYFAGFKNLSELPNYYALADIFVIPSLNEVWGIVVNEAMCFGLPIISSSSVGSASDLVKNNENGFVYQSQNIEELSECLIKLANDPDMRDKMGKKSLEIINRYSHEKDVEAFLHALKILRNK